MPGISAGRSYVGCLQTLRSTLHIEFDLRAFLQCAVPIALDGRKMHENIFAAGALDDAGDLSRTKLRWLPADP